MAIPLSTTFFKRTAFAKVFQRDALVDTLRDLRINFKITKTSAFAQSQGNIDFYNINKNSRSALEDANVDLSFYAGYGDDLSKIGLIGKGIVYLTTHRRQEADVISTCQFGEGGIVREDCPFAASFPAGTTREAIVLQILDAMQRCDGALGLGNVQTTALPPRVYGSARVFNDYSVSDSMERMMREIGWHWGISNGEIFMVPPNTPAGTAEFLLNKDSGLIGIPSKASVGTTNQAGQADGTPYYTFESLLNPLIVPASYIEVESEYVPGPADFYVERVVHQGDTHEGEFKTVIEAWQR